MSKQLSDCCKAEIKLTGGRTHEDGFACVKCGRIIGTPITNMNKKLVVLNENQSKLKKDFDQGGFEVSLDRRSVESMTQREVWRFAWLVRRQVDRFIKDQQDHEVKDNLILERMGSLVEHIICEELKPKEK